MRLPRPLTPESSAATTAIHACPSAVRRPTRMPGVAAGSSTSVVSQSGTPLVAYQPEAPPASLAGRYLITFTSVARRNAFWSKGDFAAQPEAVFKKVPGFAIDLDTEFAACKAKGAKARCKRPATLLKDLRSLERSGALTIEPDQQVRFGEEAEPRLLRVASAGSVR